MTTRRTKHRLRAAHGARCYSYARFSTQEQLKGHSLDRQVDQAKQYAKEKGLILDESLRMEDMGLSAFHGDHISRGALGQFLALVKQKKIAAGSTLIVESLDRLSRANVMEAFAQFQQIISHGIKIVTTTDRMEYSSETIQENQMYLFAGLNIMMRANEESLQKSRRLKAVWEKKRSTIDERILTRRCVAWLRVSKDGQKFEKIEDRCKIVQEIFDLASKGYGKRLIEKHLNRRGYKAFRGNNGWHASYISKILHNRAVLGEFQTYKRENRKRIAVGEAIPNYFPRIISDKLFYRVQNRMQTRVQRGGRTGDVRNLFSSFTRCGYCGSTMQFVNKGKGKKGGTYLYCDSTRRGRGCKSKLFRYADFEKAFLIYCFDLDVGLLVEDSKDSLLEQMSAVKDEILVLKNKEGICRKRITNFMNAIGDDGRREVVEEIKSSIETEKQKEKELAKSKEVLNSRLTRLMHCQETAINQVKNNCDLIRALSTASGDEKIRLRMMLRTQLRDIVKEIKVFSVGLVSTQKQLNDISRELSQLLGSKSRGKSKQNQIIWLTRIRDQLIQGKKDAEIRKKNRIMIVEFVSGKSVMINLSNADFSGVLIDTIGTKENRKQFVQLTQEMREKQRAEFIQVDDSTYVNLVDGLIH